MGGTQSKERVPPGDADSSNSSLVIHDAHFRTGSLFRYDRLCAEDDPVAILCDFAKTYKVHGGFDDVGTRTYSSAGEVPGVIFAKIRLSFCWFGTKSKLTGKIKRGRSGGTRIFLFEYMESVCSLVKQFGFMRELVYNTCSRASTYKFLHRSIISYRQHQFFQIQYLLIRQWPLWP